MIKERLNKAELLFGIYVLMKDLRGDYSYYFWERFTLLEYFLEKLIEIDDNYSYLYDHIKSWKSDFIEENYVDGKNIDYTSYWENNDYFRDIKIEEIRLDFVFFLLTKLISPPSFVFSEIYELIIKKKIKYGG